MACGMPVSAAVRHLENCEAAIRSLRPSPVPQGLSKPIEQTLGASLEYGLLETSS